MARFWPPVKDFLLPCGLAAALVGAAVAQQPEEPVEISDNDNDVVRERYPNRSVKIEREVTQDAAGNYVNHGTWKMWDEAGNVVAEGQFRDGKRYGLWTRWHRQGDSPLFGTAPYNLFSGPYISQATFDDGQLSGRWTIFDAKQHKISEFEMADGLRHGMSTWWYPTGQKMREVFYRDGLMDGDLLEWDQKSNLVVKDNFQEGRKLAPKAASYSETKRSAGKKKNEGMYLHAKQVVKDRDDWWNAKVATYASEGKDQKHGMWTEWFPTGHEQMTGNFHHDVPVGTFVWWYSNGQKALEGTYLDGKPHGRWTWWHNNGLKATEGEYLQGAEAGEWSWWNTDGRIARNKDFSGAASETAGVETKQPKPETDGAAEEVGLLPPRLER